MIADIRSYTDAARNAGKRLPPEAAKPLFAAVGAADLVASNVADRAAHLKSRASKFQAEAAKKLGQAQHSVRVLELDEIGAKAAEARGVTEGYVGLARNLLDSLSDRGQARVAQLKQDDRIARVLGVEHPSAAAHQPSSTRTKPAAATPTTAATKKPTVTRTPAKSATKAASKAAAPRQPRTH
ncbi:MAG: hypothetical protein JWN95_3593 [Frankiales bacterium]|nr:hypothetical protein [Frankiales bacterium]